MASSQVPPVPTSSAKVDITQEEKEAGALFSLGYPDPSPELKRQFHIFVEALGIYDEKDTLYGQAWKRLGALNNLSRMATKMERLLEMYWHKEIHRGARRGGKLDLDDAFDLLNYTAFFVRQADKGEWTRES